jgi:hypothetical protein
LNNLGCVCLSQHKHQLALVYFSQVRVPSAEPPNSSLWVS